MSSERKKTTVKYVTCQICDKEMTMYNIGVHVKKQHGLDPNEYKIEHGLKKDPNKKKEYTCRHCDESFLVASNAKRHYFCSEDCKVKYVREKRNDQSGGISFIDCPLCVWQGSVLKMHFTLMHPNENFEEVTKNMQTTSDHVHDKMSALASGENNVWHNHGGKYSSLSKHFTGYNDLSSDEIDNKIKIVSDKIGCSNKNNGNNTTTLLYWLNLGYTEEEARDQLRNRQITFSLDRCIEKHDAIEGHIVWQERQDKWQETLKSKSQEEIDETNIKKASKINYKTLWGLNLDADGIFYIIKVKESTYKIGITSKPSVYYRYNYSLNKDDIIVSEQAEDINHAFMIEQVLKKKYIKSIKKDDYGMYGWTEVLNNVNIDNLLVDYLQLAHSKQNALDMFNEAFNR